MHDETTSGYGRVIGATKLAESKMPPVLNAFRDQVLFMKHNLNAYGRRDVYTLKNIPVPGSHNCVSYPAPRSPNGYEIEPTSQQMRDDRIEFRNRHPN